MIGQLSSTYLALGSNGIHSPALAVIVVVLAVVVAVGALVAKLRRR